MIQHETGFERRLTDFKAELAASIERWREQRDAADAQSSPRDPASGQGSPASFAKDSRPEPFAALARLIGRDWSRLRENHEAALRELRDHAHTLSRVTIAAANSSISGMEQAGARLDDISRSLSAQMAGLSEQLASVAAGLRAEPAAPSYPTAAAPLVMSVEPVVPVTRVAPAERVEPAASAPAVEPPAPVAPFAPADPTPDFRALDRAMDGQPGPGDLPGHGDRPATLRPMFRSESTGIESAESDDVELDVEHSRGHGFLRAALLLVTAALLVAAGVTGWKAWVGARDAVARATDSQQQAEAALQRAEAELSANRDAANQQIQRLREGASRAEAMAGVVAAHDLVRYAMFGVESDATGQLLWSRSRGVVLSALRVPPAPAGMTYQLWLQTTDGTVSLGPFTPDASGRATLVLDPPAAIAPVIGALITTEPSGGSTEPSARLLAQSPQRPSP